jgi:hypothetical protein
MAVPAKPSVFCIAAIEIFSQNLRGMFWAATSDDLLPPGPRMDAIATTIELHRNTTKKQRARSDKHRCDLINQRAMCKCLFEPINGCLIQRAGQADEDQSSAQP